MPLESYEQLPSKNKDKVAHIIEAYLRKINLLDHFHIKTIKGLFEDEDNVLKRGRILLYIRHSSSNPDNDELQTQLRRILEETQQQELIEFTDQEIDDNGSIISVLAITKLDMQKLQQFAQTNFETTPTTKGAKALEDKATYEERLSNPLKYYRNHFNVELQEAVDEKILTQDLLSTDISKARRWSPSLLRKLSTASDSNKIRVKYKGEIVDLEDIIKNADFTADDAAKLTLVTPGAEPSTHSSRTPSKP